jgi:hypothetical protein
MGVKLKSAKIVNEMIGDNQEKLDRLLDLYLSGEIEKDLLIDREQRLEETITGLENQNQALNGRMRKEVITREQIQDIQAFVSEIGEGLLESENDIKVKRQFFRLLDLQVTLGFENGERIIDLECILGSKRGKESEFTTRTI